MPNLKVYAVDKNQKLNLFLFDPQTSTLSLADGTPYSNEKAVVNPVSVVSRDTPGTKSGAIAKLKIQLGLSCNYSCEYCSQRFVPHADRASEEDADMFVANLPEWLSPTDSFSIEFWGGEPLVYWKTLKPLAEKLRALYPKAAFSIITNGSLLTVGKNVWLDELGFSVGISHDGPGQWVRGPDPLDDPRTREAILDLFYRLHPTKRVSFNACLNKYNASRSAITSFFKTLTGFDDVVIGEGAFVDAYDDGGIAMSLDKSDSKAFSWNSFVDLHSADSQNFSIVPQKVISFIEAIKTNRSAESIGQKCGMDRSDNIAVDLKGNVLTCQNVSSVSVAPNGESHLLGNVSDLSAVKLKTSTHWSHRKDCPTCPVLQLCSGSCMFLEDELWEKSCNNAFADNIPFFAAAFEILTGMIPVKIEGGRKDREDIFENKPYAPKRVIPIIAK